MRRTLPSLCACAVLSSLAACAGSGDKTAAPQQGVRALDGAWRLVAFKSGDAAELTTASKGIEHVKFVAGGRFIWTNVKDGRITSACAGTCEVLADRYAECPESVSLASDKWLVGKKLSFQWKLEGDTWCHRGVIAGPRGEEKVYQVWQRMK
ncbi:MAG TPA: hypothetical protein DCM87_13760 [Planctomycetes bacterium]|nr:hypothetical protein [Planctomycetota bacterium]